MFASAAALQLKRSMLDDLCEIFSQRIPIFNWVHYFFLLISSNKKNRSNNKENKPPEIEPKCFVAVSGRKQWVIDYNSYKSYKVQEIVLYTKSMIVQQLIR